ncbi:pyridoxal phosphate-dependent aminotransferase [Hydrogenophilus thiooxidans]|uniref:pyridoxal phosphate-dependent aminotransferase n=1 Tax=Hydrogenophilus thiooxidans TaxID=2820326 RepID=UPI001C242EC1|nr:pyridoxal phosphate-dependent aminotransferase [Hydrogenophilus thiooxidans]
MLGLSSRVKAISPSATLAIDTRVKEMIQKGEDVINLSVGEPDTPTPLRASYRAIEGIVNGFTKYTNSSGIVELRKRLARKLAEENGLEYDPEQIVVSVGGKHSLYNAFMAICNPGDEVVLPAPYWVSYIEQIKLADAVPVVVPTDESTGFKLTPEKLASAITPRTKALVLNSPSNPTGAAYTREELQALACVVAERDMYVVSDEIYEKLLYTGEHVSIAALGPALKERTLVVNGFSKAFGMTGWRLGYMAGPKDVMKAVADFQSHVTSNVTSIAQLAALGALDDYDPAQREMFRERLEYVYGRVAAMKHVRCVKPQGAFYVFPNVGDCFGKTFRGAVICDADHLCELILEHCRVGVVAGTGFGAPRNIRISYAVRLERLREAMDRLERFFAEIE